MRDADLCLSLKNASGPLSTMVDKCAIPHRKGMIDSAVSLLSCWVALKETCCKAVECHHDLAQRTVARHGGVCQKLGCSLGLFPWGEDLKQALMVL